MKIKQYILTITHFGFINIAYSQSYLYDSLMQLAAQKNHEGKYTQALSLYNKIVSACPHHTEAWLQRGNTYIYLFEFEKAAQNYYSALYTDSLYAPVYAYLGEYYYLLSQPFKALEMLNKALMLDSLNAYALTHKGLVYYEMSDYDKVFPFLDKALHTDSTNSMYYYNRGYCNFASKKYSQAIYDFEKGLKCNPSRFFAERIYEYYTQALCLSGRSAEALSLCDSALAKGFTFYYHKATAYTYQLKYDSALLYATQHLKVYPKDLPTLVLIADIYTSINDSKNSCAYMKRACRRMKKTNTYLINRDKLCEEYTEKCK